MMMIMMIIIDDGDCLDLILLLKSLLICINLLPIISKTQTVGDSEWPYLC